MSVSNLFAGDTKATFKDVSCNNLDTETFHTENFTATNITADNITSTITTNLTGVTTEGNVNLNNGDLNMNNGSVLLTNGGIVASDIITTPTSTVSGKTGIFTELDLPSTTTAATWTFLATNPLPVPDRQGELHFTMDVAFGPGASTDITITHPDITSSHIMMLTDGGRATAAGVSSAQALFISVCVKSISTGQVIFTVANQGTGNYAGSHMDFFYLII